MTGSLDPRDVEATLATLATMGEIDFRDYLPGTVTRAILLCMAAAAVPDLAAYRALLETSPRERTRLIDAIVVPFTAFFRDAPVFEALATTVLPALVANLPPKTSLRAWSSGVATGEEAWSLAMIMVDACAPFGKTFEIIASDTDARSLETAERGIYDERALAELPTGFAARFFSKEDGGASVKRLVRERVHFSHHHLTSARLAPPEAVVPSFHFISCRNVLMYLDRNLQLRALERLAAVLEPGGALVLGSVEPLPASATLGLVPYPGLPSSLHIFLRAGGPLPNRSRR